MPLIRQLHPKAEQELESILATGSRDQKFHAAMLLADFDRFGESGIPNGIFPEEASFTLGEDDDPRTGDHALHVLYSGPMLAVLAHKRQEIWLLHVRDYASRLDESAALREARSRLATD